METVISARLEFVTKVIVSASSPEFFGSTMTLKLYRLLWVDKDWNLIIGELVRISMISKNSWPRLDSSK